MRVPYLIQRATINRPMGDYKGVKLSKAVTFEYMGSAEFEFGAIPFCFRLMKANQESIQISVVKEIKDKEEHSLRALHYMNDEDFEQYKEYLKKLRAGAGNIPTKEMTYFNVDNKYEYARTDFWWDIENNVIWSFDKNFMNRLQDHLEESFKVL